MSTSRLAANPRPRLWRWKRRPSGAAIQKKTNGARATALRMASSTRYSLRDCASRPGSAMRSRSCAEVISGISSDSCPSGGPATGTLRR